MKQTLLVILAGSILLAGCSTPKIWEYKVVDTTPRQLEAKLNELSRQGDWSVVSASLVYKGDEAVGGVAVLKRRRALAEAPVYSENSR